MQETVAAVKKDLDALIKFIVEGFCFFIALFPSQLLLFFPCLSLGMVAPKIAHTL